MTQDNETPDAGLCVHDLAIDFYKGGLNCAESVFAALQEVGALEGVPAETIAMATGFGGGIGLTGATCGALSAAVMANGAVHGRKDPLAVDPAVRGGEIAQKYYRRFNNLAHEFAERNGSTSCAEITGVFDDWESRDRRKVCLKMIGDTARLAWEYLQIPQEEGFTMPYGENLRNLE